TRTPATSESEGCLAEQAGRHQEVGWLANEYGRLSLYLSLLVGGRLEDYAHCTCIVGSPVLELRAMVARTTRRLSSLPSFTCGAYGVCVRWLGARGTNQGMMR
ncbi:unnamed protein product, partial [Laminaria digitata]